MHKSNLSLICPSNSLLKLPNAESSRRGSQQQPLTTRPLKAIGMNYFSKPLSFVLYLGAIAHISSAPVAYESNSGDEDWIYIECRSVCEHVCETGAEERHVDVLSEDAVVLNAIPWHNLTHADLHQAPSSSKIKIDDAIKSLSSSGYKSTKAHSHGSLKQRFRVYHGFGKSDPKLFTWPCEDHCRYTCMHHVVDQRKSQLPVRQFHGKWPFKRVFFCQEILSSVYSLGNCIPYLVFAFSAAFWRIRPIMRWLTISFITVWIASTVFHCRDTDSTMMLDYYSVLFGGLMNIAASADSIFFRNKPSTSLRTILFTSLILFWFILVGYMTFIEFDFFMHIVSTIIFGITGTLLWLTWYALHRRHVSHAWMMPLSSVSLFPLLIAFELNDFPPGEMGLADAHSFWHLTSIPVAVLIATFFFKEAQRDSAELVSTLSPGGPKSRKQV